MISKTTTTTTHTTEGKAAMVEIKWIGKCGVLNKYELYCDDQDIDTVWSGAKQIFANLVDSHRNGNTITVCGSKRDIAALNRMVERINQHSKKIEQAIDDMINNPEPTREERIVVAAGKYHVGDMLHGREIVGLGSQWRARDDDYAVHGIEPWADWIQYAYLK